MVETPADRPDTIPEEEPMVAKLPDKDQDPPEEASLSVVALPMHTFIVPVIVAGSGLTVTTTDVAQPVPLLV